MSGTFRALLESADLKGLKDPGDEHPFSYCMENVIPAMREKGKEPDDPEAFCGWWKAEHAQDAEVIVKPINGKWVLFNKSLTQRLGIYETQVEAEGQKRTREARGRMAQARDLHLRGALGTAKVEKIDGREHLVVPVVALQEGVIHAVNAENPEFVSATVLEKSATQWEGFPLVINHPSKNGKKISASEPGVLEASGFGVIRTPKFIRKRLGLEALVDVERLQKLGEDQLLEDLRAGEPIEVSVGAFVRVNEKEGTYLGKKYKGEWLDIIPDHLAFLPNGRGACSLEMGCGAHRAAMLVTAEGFEEISDLACEVFSTLSDKSLDERISAVATAVEKQFGSLGNTPSTSYVYPQQIFDDRVIIRKGEELWSVPYTVNQSGAIIFGEPTKVKQTYVEAGMRVNVGARNSSKDLRLIQSMHDSARMLGAKCDGEE